ncbi:MAG: SDR family oxidoreductase [Blautia marasmi]
MRELAADGQKTIYCLLRKGGDARLDQALAFYFGKNCADRIRRQTRILEGDVTLPDLALKEQSMRI